MALDLAPIHAMIDEGLPSSPPAAPRSNTAESVRNFLKAFVSILAAQNYAPDHNWSGTQLRFTRADGQPGNYVDLKGATGAKGDKGDKGDTGNTGLKGDKGDKGDTGDTGAPGSPGAPGAAGTLTNSGIPARAIPINRSTDRFLVQRSDNVIEKATLFQIAGGQPLVTGNLVANGNTEFGDLSNLTPGDVSKLLFDGTQSPPAGGRGAFKYTGSNGFVRTSDLISVNLLRKHRISVVARHGDVSGANYDANARCYFGIICYDSDGNEITPPHFAKVAGTNTTLAAALNTGDTTMTLASSANWHTGSSASNRGFAWYPYTSNQGQVFPDYGYSRKTSSQYNIYWQSAGGTWAQGGISGNVVTLRAPWPGPNLPAGTKIANVVEGGTYLYSSVLNNGLVTNSWTTYEFTVQGVNPANTEDPANLMFRPGTAYIRPILLINYNNPAASTTFYFTMLDVREVTGADSTSLLAGNNTFAGKNTFNDDVTVKRIAASGNMPSVTGGSGAGPGATVTLLAGSTDMAGTIQIVSAPSAASNQTIANVTFNVALSAAPKVVLISARNNQAGMAMTRFYIGTRTATGFILMSTDATLSSGTTYQLDYLVIC